ncbi:hypothetical protein GQ44DRAFT_776130 [Phaeosphaeriaceae sp. PMI808]|nr:hypothetical protein GQ44DRAFT_776130 [Phaeosphaeriaceae sp. PMI808]
MKALTLYFVALIALSTANQLHVVKTERLSFVLHPTTIREQPTSSTSTASHTPPPKPDPNLEKSPKVGNKWTFSVTVGNQRQHVGSWSTRTMRDEIVAHLNPHCTAITQWGANACSSKASTQGVYYAIPEGILHAGKIFLGGNALSLSIISNFIPETDGKVLVQNFIA